MLPPASRCTTSCAAPCAITPARSSRRSSRARSWARPPRPMARCRARARPPCTAATAAPPHPEVLPLLVLSLAAGCAGPPTAPASHRGGRSAHWNGRSLRMTRHHQAAVAALVAVLAASRAVAQQPTEQRRVDSLAAEVRALKARLDSIRAQLAHRPAAAEAVADTSLAALRAAAAVAAGTDTTKMKADTAQQTRFIGRERNQAQLNPEISATGDVRAYGTAPGIQRENFDAREFEVGFQSALDPYSHTKIFVSLENGNVSVEEGYAYWTGLPGRLRFDIGKFRQQFGELNRWHLHAVPETEYPLAVTTYLGEDGLSGTGVGLYRAFGGLGTHELTAQVTRSASDSELFGNSGRPTYLLHLLNFWQLNHSTYMQIGGTALYGTNPDSALRTKVGGLEFRLTWRPPLRAMYHEWTLRGELLALQKQVAGA